MTEDAHTESIGHAASAGKGGEDAARSAEDYINAANAVLDILDVAVSFLPAGGAAVKVASKAVKYARLAQPALDADRSYNAEGTAISRVA